MSGFKSYFPTAALYTPTTTMSAVSQAMSAASATPAPSHGGFKHPAAGFMAPSKQEFGLDYFLKGALAGGICCSITHGALTPVDVVKTRMQLDPAKYTGMVQGFQKTIAEEGAGALLTGKGKRAHAAQNLLLLAIRRPLRLGDRTFSGRLTGRPAGITSSRPLGAARCDPMFPLERVSRTSTRAFSPPLAPATTVFVASEIKTTHSC